MTEATRSVVLHSGLSPQLRLQIHGGAWDIPANLRAAHRAGVSAAFAIAQQLFEEKKPPLEIVVAVLSCLENDPVFDAGFGSFLNEEGEVELDAAVMEGQGLLAGAVAALPAFANPSQIALRVLEQTEHVLLVGQGAARFACQQGFVRLQASALVHPREIETHKNWIQSGKPNAKVYFAKPENSPLAGPEPDRRGTVGVVLGVQNAQGQFDLFAGTSTGGTPGKRVGRVGDVAVVGAGVYADNEGACVSCTGWGEGLLRIGAAKSVSEKVAAGMHPQNAVESVLKTLFTRTGGHGGILAINARGEYGAAYSTPDMAYAGEACEPLNVACEPLNVSCQALDVESQRP